MDLFLIYCIGMGLMCNSTMHETIVQNITVSDTINIPSLTNLSYLNSTRNCNGTWVEIQRDNCIENMQEFYRNYPYRSWSNDCNVVLRQCVNASWNEMGRDDRKFVVVKR